MRRTIVLISLGLCFSACTTRLTVRGPNTNNVSVMSHSDASAASSASTSSQPAIEYGDSDAVNTASGSQVKNVDHLPERILSTGIVEIGEATAPITVLTFTHQSCTYCHTLSDEILPQLLSEFVQTGKVRYQIALLNIRKYPQSDAQARALICGAVQGKGLVMHRALFNQATVDDKSLGVLAAKLNLNTVTFKTCLKAPGTESQIQLQQSMAQSLGATLVPTFFIQGEKSVGLPDYPDLRGKIEEAIAKK